MANTTTHGRGTVQITGLDADWLYSTNGGFDANMGMCVSAIEFVPSTANDRMIIHDGGIDAAPIFDSGLVTTVDPVIKYFNPPKWTRPVIDISDCTLGTAANAKVIIDYV